MIIKIKNGSLQIIKNVLLFLYELNRKENQSLFKMPQGRKNIFIFRRTKKMNAKLKRTLLCTLSGVMAISALAGCGGGSKNSATTEDGRVRLLITTSQKDVNEEEYNKAVKRYAEFEQYYKETYPDSKGVSVEPHYYGFNVKDYAAMAAGDQLATFYYVPLTEAKGIMDAGYAKDITKWMEEYGYLQGIDEKIRKNIERDGKIYLMPTAVYSVGLAVNMDLMKQAGYVEADGTPHQPATFEELAQMAGEITKKTGKPGFIMPTTGNAGGWRFTPVAWAYGVKFMEQDADGNWKATFNTPECVEALQWVKDLKWKYNAIPENVLMDNAKQRNAFGAGEAAMTFAEGSSTSTFLAGGMQKDNLGFIQMPAGPKRHVTLIGGSYNVFNSNATDEQIDAAFKYLDWAGSGRVLDDAVKAKMQEDIQLKIDKGEQIGVLNSSPYTDDDPKRAYEIMLNTKSPEEGGFRNVDENLVKLYNDQSGIEWQQEEPVEAQALYAALENAIQAVLTDENADCAKLIEEAYKNFQVTLDTVNNAA